MSKVRLDRAPKHDHADIRALFFRGILKVDLDLLMKG
jgi:hypothetical protein